ncbi:peptidoglycan-binding protein [Nitrosomonas sp.]|uniref:peptidoglycan-binding protein n=1 Tax=Nitrosomonas sp. TaxID=42353 RepID=UPI002609596A|nr:peptidoglycan-binding protein [Nitrosomonas sp.]
MSNPLRKSDQGSEVKELQTLLMEKGYLTNEEINGVFDQETYRAVRTFQSQNLDKHGQPLVVDGVVGDLTWWSLKHPKPIIEAPSAVDYRAMPPASMAGSERGRAALQVAIDELKAGAGEVGGNNRGPFVKKYLHGLAPEGEKGLWCAGFVSYCYSQHPAGIPFKYTVGARDVLQQFKKNGWAHPPGSGYVPKPGDIVVWWREQLSSGKGHIGLVHQLRDGFLYTIEGNKSSKVQGFNYVFSRMDKLLGFGQVPDT